MENRNAFKDALDKCDKLIDQIPKEGSKKDSLLYGYFISLVQLAKDMDFLKDNYRIQSFLLISRAFVETYLDFKLITEIEDYEKRLILDSYKRELKSLDQVLGSKDLIIEDRVPLKGRKYQLESDIEMMSKHDVPQINTIRDKFEILNMQPEYSFLYSSLSSFSHNDLQKILENHFDVYPDKVVLKDSSRPKEYHVSMIMTYLEVFMNDARKVLDKKCSDVK
ncbi:DUF5677 domain-containing protein [Reichenbachiella agariperforans]|uniref:DUF5677 domain-containing protein n=1 Tax=Reichenbachiella agariperforans TaxID=156994 RepID=UPI001C090792|nr:DUF5677 domain-containing protein [Reichenbachiella agariperforans]MBU2913043.1 hypothetical protein [Reichenbachiella agariperforans]